LISFAKLCQVFPQGTQLHVEDLLVKNDEAVVGLHSLATAKNGMRFDNVFVERLWRSAKYEEVYPSTDRPRPHFHRQP
jgi:hypothetical protein